MTSKQLNLHPILLQVRLLDISLLINDTLYSDWLFEMPEIIILMQLIYLILFNCMGKKEMFLGNIK